MNILDQIIAMVNEHTEKLRLIEHFADKVATLFEKNDENIKLSYKNILKGFEDQSRDLKEAYEAINVLSRRIDTLEILASEKFAEEIEAPIKSLDKIGNS